MTSSVLLVGCGRLGGAILDGWLKTEAVPPAQIAIQSPSMKPPIERAVARGAVHAPTPPEGIGTVVLAVKSAKWRDVAGNLVPRLSHETSIVSVMAGVRAASLREVFGQRSLARVMPTTAVSVARGVAGYWTESEQANAAAQRLFDPIAQLVRLADEDLIDVATAVSGSGAAYAYAFVRALARAGIAQGLSAEQALTLAVGTTEGALARLDGSVDPDALIAEVASPGGTTQAGLSVLEPELSRLIEATVAAALSRARELAAP